MISTPYFYKLRERRDPYVFKTDRLRGGYGVWSEDDPGDLSNLFYGFRDITISNKTTNAQNLFRGTYLKINLLNASSVKDCSYLLSGINNYSTINSYNFSPNSNCYGLFYGIYNAANVVNGFPIVSNGNYFGLFAGTTNLYNANLSLSSKQNVDYSYIFAGAGYPKTISSVSGNFSHAYMNSSFNHNTYGVPNIYNFSSLYGDFSNMFKGVNLPSYMNLKDFMYKFNGNHDNMFAYSNCNTLNFTNCNTDFRYTFSHLNSYGTKGILLTNFTGNYDHCFYASGSLNISLFYTLSTHFTDMSNMFNGCYVNIACNINVFNSNCFNMFSNALFNTYVSNNGINGIMGNDLSHMFENALVVINGWGYNTKYFINGNNYSSMFENCGIVYYYYYNQYSISTYTISTEFPTENGNFSNMFRNCLFYDISTVRMNLGSNYNCANMFKDTRTTSELNNMKNNYLKNHNDPSISSRYYANISIYTPSTYITNVNIYEAFQNAYINFTSTSLFSSNCYFENYHNAFYNSYITIPYTYFVINSDTNDFFKDANYIRFNTYNSSNRNYAPLRIDISKDVNNCAYMFYTSNFTIYSKANIFIYDINNKDISNMIGRKWGSGWLNIYSANPEYAKNCFASDYYPSPLTWTQSGNDFYNDTYMLYVVNYSSI